jgi:hypothetical protein
LFLIPPFRQYKGYFFYYFCSISFSGIFSFLLYNCGINQNIILLLSSNFALLSLHYEYVNKKNNILILLAYVVTSFIIYLFFSYKIVFAYFILNRIIIIGFVVNRALKFILTKQKLLGFHVALILFELPIVIKYLAYILMLNSRFTIYITINAIEGLFALFFIIFREDSPYFAFPVKLSEILLRSESNPNRLDNENM